MQSNIRHFFSINIRKLKIKTRLFLFLVLAVTLISFGATSFARYYTQRISNQFIYQYLQSEQKIVTDNLAMYLEEIIMVSLRYKNTRDFFRILEDQTLTRQEKETAFKETAASIQSGTSGSITGVWLIDQSDNIYLLSGDDNLPFPDITALDPDTDNPYYYVGNICYDMQGNYYVTVSMRFYNYHTLQEIGYLIFYLPLKPMATLFDDLFTTSGTTFLTDASGIILSHKDDSYIGLRAEDLGYEISDASFSVKEAQIDGQDLVVVSTSLNMSTSRIGFPWRLVTIIPHSFLYRSLAQLQSLLLCFTLLIILAASFVSLHLSSKLTGSIRMLSNRIKSLREGNLNAFLDQTPGDELWELEQGYNEMVVRINELLEKNKQEQIKKRELEFTALQAQINPHFLYNTLDTIGWIALLKEQPEIEQMVMELSRFFRLSLHKGDQMIPLEDEIGIVSSYLKIEQLRNPGKFDVIYEIKPDLLQIRVPKIILQPIVENAVKHGISQVRRHGLIIIRGYHKDDDVFLEVSDNGGGIRPKDTHMPGSGYGLTNIRERIQLEYGADYGLTINSHEGEGTTVQIHIRF